jgi:hypothetical protein
VENCSGTTQISALVNKKTTVLATGTYSLTAGTKGIEDLQMTHSGAADLARATLASPIKVTLVISLVNGANLSKPLNII